jgi:hypothetical protein
VVELSAVGELAAVAEVDDLERRRVAAQVEYEIKV